MYLLYENKKTIEKILETAYEKKPFNFNYNKGNKVFHGENLNVMSSLLVSGYGGKFDLIYIDPPYSTGNDFVVTEARVSTISAKKQGILAYSDKFDESEYIEFLRERLVILRELLSEEGSIYLHIDTKVGHYVKIIMDEVFGRSNFLSEITRRKSNPKNFARKAWGNEKDVILFYAKNNGKHIWNDVKSNYNEDEILRRFSKVDEFGNHYTTVPVHAPGESNGETGKSWRGINPPEGRHWRVSPEKLEKLDNEGLIEWSKTGNPRLKKFATDHQGKKIQDIWLDFKDPQNPDYPSQKNSELLELIVKQSSNEGSFILDAFAGSGSFLLAGEKLLRNYVGVDASGFAIEVMKKKLGKGTKEKVEFLEIGV